RSVPRRRIHQGRGRAGQPDHGAESRRRVLIERWKDKAAIRIIGRDMGSGRKCRTRRVPSPKAAGWRRRHPFLWVSISTVWPRPGSTGSSTRVETMDTCKPILNDAYLEYATRLLQHHSLLAAGEHSADETIAVEDEMSELWEQLDSAQRMSMSGLGSDLNWV